MKIDNEIIAELGYKVLRCGSIIGIHGRKIKTVIKSGYEQLNLTIAGKTKSFLVHRLVAMVYHPNPNNKPQVNHIDGAKLNNHADNLEWSTRSENVQHGFDTGLITPPWFGKSGKLHPRGKTIQQIFNSEVIEEFGSIREAGLITGISRGTIDQVLSGRGKTAGGFQWKYKE